jgi:peptidoglycan hydrolase-like protein with peptidoglycan-binding domain
VSHKKKGENNMRKGAAGSEVVKLQADLEFLGYNTGLVKFDGVFGDLTEGAVKLFQRFNGLKVDGWVGPKTKTAMYKKLLEMEGLNQ